ncbi:similar to Saccharomyces cerevisiae YHR161C YAP1801 Protein involved in clathrin cage assembly [Maudiozyma barnettii]|uniref:Similar to Saccharomyces cerevisiae YHR161C YAP1801 Protein involved in clathrin cage assembly n=1 Tax=Maudiozyma barnettii TaxID=61262 RepID=A0A8H2VG58_9SACH|nr:Yap1801p [Kazachstania barnettii]CAB4254881.1 similar to Saccharomyces cerevisiae YHR161C YAP1801 Protein involved in clathrin cage assembly [Kazachstania barnettii]CAD1783123.1 similar to Saccharomyces cerevisiae YHR161C YAP1801 Protein involved in clathrin cage assembly [Kazachstania barnettii]
MTTYMKLVKGATKIKMAPPKQKYIDPILLGTSQQQDFSEIVRALGPRIRDSAFTVAYKSLIVAHLMMREGDRDVAIRYFSRNSDFFDVSNVSRSASGRFEGHAVEKYCMYLKLRADEFDAIHVDYVRDGYSSLRSIITDRNNDSIDNALNHVESLETQITALLKNRYTVGDLSNDLLLFAFKLLVFDLLALYNALNEGIITLLESFFELSHDNAERTLDLYKRFVDLTENVVRYLKTGKAVGLKIPVIKHITTKLVRSLEEHLREDNITHNTFNDENVTTSTTTNNNNNNNNNGDMSPTKGLAQRRLDEIREQKRQLQEQLAHPQLLINATGNTPMMLHQAATLPALPSMNIAEQQQQLQQQQLQQQQQQQQLQLQQQQQLQLQQQQQQPVPMMPQATSNNPFMNQVQPLMQQQQQPQLPLQAPQQMTGQIQPEHMGQAALQYSNTTPMLMGQNGITTINLPQQTHVTLPQQSSLPQQQQGGNKNPFSMNNINDMQQPQPEQNNPFSQRNYNEQTSVTNNAATTVAATNAMNNNPFSLQPQDHTLQTAMTAPVSLHQTGSQFTQQFSPEQQQPFAQQSFMQPQQLQQQQPLMQQQPQQQEFSLIDF